MQEVFEQFLETSDPLLLGCADVDQLCLAYDTTKGLDWLHVAGVMLLKRRTLYPTPQRWQDGLWCGGESVPGGGSGTIKNWPGWGHEAGQGYQYLIARAFGNGYVSAASTPVRVDFDDQGDRITPALPKWPEHVRAVAIAAGKFQVTWAYEPFGQGGPPTDFQVFGGSTPATIDYNTPLGTVAFHNQRRLAFETGAFGEGTERAFAVRGRNSSGVAEKNTATTGVVTARVDGPAGAGIYVASTRRPVR